MKNFLLNFIFLGVLLPLSYGQTNLLEGQSTNLKMTVKKYEILQTEIRNTDNQLVYANTDLVLIGEKTSNLDLEKFKGKSKASPQMPANQFLQANRPNSESILFLDNNNKRTSPNLVFNAEQTTFRPKKLNVGYSNNPPTNTYLNLATLSLPENRSITDLPGYVPVVSYGLKLR